MNDIHKKLADFEKLLDEKQKELLKKQNEINMFVDTAHKAKATKAYQTEVRALATEINNFVILLIDAKQDAGDLRNDVEKLRGDGMDLNRLTRDLGQALADDLVQRQRDEDKSSVDAIKSLGFIFGTALAFVSLAHNTFDPDLAHKKVETSAGVLVGFCIGYRNQIKSTFKRVAEVFAEAPQKAGEKSRKGSAREFVCSLARPVGNNKSFVLVVGRPDSSQNTSGPRTLEVV